MSKRYRDYSLSFLMLAGAAVFAAILLGQWVHYHHREAEMKSRLAANVEVHPDAPVRNEESYQLPGLEEYNEMIARPLFIEGRKPPAEDANTPETPVAEKLPLTLKLMGVVFAPGETLGLFVDAKGKYKRLRVNDSIDGWKVAKIDSDKAVMEQDGAREELKLIKPRPKKTAAQPNQPGFPGQPPGQQAPPFGPNNGNLPIPTPTEPNEPEQPNEAPDETAAPPEETPNEQ